jgi:succinate-semialdehyde dehydrogenase / glutarate-semialdehyde dehydrogenase
MSHLICNSHYIDGKWVSSPTTFPVRNPATGDIIVEIARGGEAEAQQAVAAAAKAFPPGAR